MGHRFLDRYKFSCPIRHLYGERAAARGGLPRGSHLLIDCSVKARRLPKALLLGLVALVVLLASGCASGASPSSGIEGGDALETVRAGELPSFARSRGSRVQEAYRFAVSNPEILRYIPCYCGCSSIGHTNNEDCYVSGRPPDGTITFTSHAAT